MEETRKFVCRFCNKRFPSGKSLGGHIRTHMNQQHSRNKAIAGSRKRKKKRDLLSSSEDYYGLREKIPRNTKRSVHNHPFFTLHHNKKLCRECGKGFSSLKALCGHMACHSTSEKVEKHKFSAMMDYAPSDTETSDSEDLKRTSFVNLNKNNNNPTCSSVSEVEQEVRVEEVATCLMLLSEGFYSHKGRFDLDKGSTNSDNYSAIVEAKAKSHSADARIGINDGQNKVKNSVYSNASDEIVKEVVGKDKKVKFSYSRYSRYGSKTEDSNVSMHGVLRNDVFNNQPKVEDGYGFKDYGDVFDEPRKMKIMNSNRSRNNESKKLDKFDDSFNRDKQEHVGKNLDYQVPCKKKKKTCFPNHEVYSKKDSYGSESSSYASAEKSTDGTDSDSFPCSSFKKPNKSSKKSKNQVMKKSKKTKEHECPICYKTFGSGQALGGHKRSHFVGGGFEENNINTGMVRQESSSPSSPPPSLSPAIVPCLIDLNLPAPADE